MKTATAAKITSQSDADTLPDTITDGIEISSTYTGDLILPTVTTVVGNITYSGPDLINFSAPVLSVVVGTFNFTGAFKSYVLLSLNVANWIRGYTDQGKVVDAGYYANHGGADCRDE